jgi:hypothetical protein
MPAKPDWWSSAAKADDPSVHPGVNNREGDILLDVRIRGHGA